MPSSSVSMPSVLPIPFNVVATKESVAASQPTSRSVPGSVGKNLFHQPDLLPGWLA